MKISEIPEVTAECDNDFIFAFCTFLDEFYHADGGEKELLLADKPEKGVLKIKEFCMLACAAHKLANDNKFDPPEWVYDKKFILKTPAYAFDTKNKEYQKLLKETTPAEYKTRNLFYGENVLKRV